MRKFINIFLAVLITLFSFPFGGLNVSAEEKTYDNIEDGEHSIKVELLTDGTDDTSVADQYVSEDAVLNIKDGKAELVIEIPKMDGFEFKEFAIEGYKFDKSETEDNDYYHFKLDKVKPKLASVVTYSVNIPPYLDFDHENLGMDVKLIGLDNLPKVEVEEEDPTPENPDEDNGSDEGDESDENETEKPEYKPAEEERVVGSLNSESDADEVYELNYDTDSRAMKNQLENPVKLLVKGDKEYIQIPVNEGGAQFFRSLKFNGEEVVWNSITEGPYTIQYELTDGIESEIDVSMVIDTGKMVMSHDEINLWFDKDTLKMTKVKDKRVTGDIVSEEEAKSVQLYDFATDSPGTAGQFKNPVKLLEFNDEKYLQIEVNGAQYFKSLKFNGEEVVWNSIDKAPNIVQYKLDLETLDDLPFGEDDPIDVSMIIDTGHAVMPHDGIGLWLDNTVSSIELNNKTNIFKKDRIMIDESGNSLKTPKDLPKDVSVTIKSDKNHIKKYGNQYADAQNLEIAGEVYEFTFENLNGEFEAFELVMKYNTTEFPSDNYDVGIYYFNTDTKEWELQEAAINKPTGELTLEVDHFSTYGVFAQEKSDGIEDETDGTEDETDGTEDETDGTEDETDGTEDETDGTEDETDGTEDETDGTEDETEGTEDETDGTEDETDGTEDETDATLTPDKAYEINYTILNENGKDASVADGFFVKPGTLLEYDGNTYFQLTVESAEMVKALSNKYGDYVLVDEKDGSKTMQLRVPNDLSDIELDMHIVVPAGAIPGFPGYDEEHGAILTFDKDSKKEISVKGLELAASGDQKNGNGPFDGDAETPEPTPVDPTPVDPTPSPTPSPTPEPEPTPDPEKVNLTPDKAYEINYTILQENGKDVSVADGFFQKPGTLLEYNGKTYFQLTVESAEMVKSLSNKYGDYILVDEKDGTKTMQLRVPNDLSDMKLDMHIVVPGGAVPGFPGYDSKHGAILTFDKASKKEISVEGLEVAASGDQENKNGPYVEGAGLNDDDDTEKDNNGKTPTKPALGDNGDGEGKDKKGGDNPQTGDTSQIFFFSILLAASLGVLTLQIRRRLSA